MGNRIVSQELMDMENRVREFWNKRSWSQENLAEKADISLNTVSRIECGHTVGAPCGDEDIHRGFYETGACSRCGCGAVAVREDPGQEETG